MTDTTNTFVCPECGTPHEWDNEHDLLHKDGTAVFHDEYTLPDGNVLATWYCTSCIHVPVACTIDNDYGSYVYMADVRDI